MDWFNAFIFGDGVDCPSNMDIVLIACLTIFTTLSD